MTNILWKTVAWSLSRKPVATLLIMFAQRFGRPDHLGDYMHRWHLVDWKWGLPFACRVHWIRQPDSDRNLHDHPWNWRTIILRSGYVEEDVFGRREMLWRGCTASHSAETFHRIDWVPENGVWTLFLTGPRKNAWGFMAGFPPRKFYYRDYLSNNEIRPGDSA